jgi:hypothetical protein
MAAGWQGGREAALGRVFAGSGISLRGGCVCGQVKFGIIFGEVKCITPLRCAAMYLPLPSSDEA